MEKEALTLEALAIAIAAKNSGGFVIVQVKRVAERGVLNARQVKIPGGMVACVVVSHPDNHWQTFAEEYNLSFSSEVKIPMESHEPMEMGARKIIARRAAFELKETALLTWVLVCPKVFPILQVRKRFQIILY